jgi:hypothetical protein
MGSEGGNEPGLLWQLPIVLPGIGRARHDTPPSDPIWVPPLRATRARAPGAVSMRWLATIWNARPIGSELI